MSESVILAAQRLRAAVDARSRAEVEEAVAIVELARVCRWPEDANFDVIGTRPVRIGADGTALVDEFLPLEVAAIKAISVASATWLIRDLVNLAGRHPQLWLQVRRGRLPVFRACQLVAEAARYELSGEQALQLDAELAPKVATLPWPRVLRLARGLIADIAADKISELAERARAARYVRRYPTEDPSVGFIGARLDLADAIEFEAAVARVADALAAGGDPDPVDLRRAKAMGVLADPARAHALLSAGRDSRSGSPEIQLYVHVAEETLLTGRGTVRVEGVGALAATMLTYLIGHRRVRLTPVVRPYADLASDSYEIPERIRRQVLLRDQLEVFPYSSRSARGADLDHTESYRPGLRRQTRAGNLGPLSRKVHRGKTHGGWQLSQPTPGVFCWRSPAGFDYRVSPSGTSRLDSPFDKAIYRLSPRSARNLDTS